MHPVDAHDTLIGITPGMATPVFAPLVWTPALPRCEAVVIIPAKDEAASIRGTLHALAKQRDLSGRPLDHARYEVILLCNNCTDDTAYHARDFARVWPSFALHVVEIALTPPDANVGHARRLLMDEASRRLHALGTPRGVILSTDADTRVAPTWVAAMLATMRAGADAVGGRIVTELAGRATMPPALRLRYLRDAAYQYFAAELEACLDPVPHDPWPRHHQHFGANMAVTAAMYRRVGGLPRVPVLEDVALYDALLRVDARVRHTPAARVVTSARRVGRAERGMANTLARWESLGEAPPALKVETVVTLETRFRARSRLRALWGGMQRGYPPGGDEIAVTARDFAVEPGWLTAALRGSETFGTLHEATVARCGEESRWVAPAPVDVAEAVVGLRARLSAWRTARWRELAIRQPLPEVEAIRRRPLTDVVLETGPLPLLKLPVNGIPIEGALGDAWRPVDEEQMPPRFEVRHYPRPRPRQIAR